MKNTLKVTSALSDPTRYYIYEYMIKNHEAVNVSQIAKAFDIHPNVARLHLTKLEDVQLINSYTEKTGKGGRPGRLYQLADEAVELNFPYRDYKLLASIAMEAFAHLGEPGKQALYETGKKYGNDLIKQHVHLDHDELSTKEKLQMIEEAATLFGMYPEFDMDDSNQQLFMTIANCPFKEVAMEADNKTTICAMHQYFLQGMLEVLFSDIQLVELDNILDGCKSCSYAVEI